MKILVTGGAGYIGSTIAHSLVAQGHEVFILDSLDKGQRSNLPEAARFLQARVADAAAFREIASVAGRVDTAIHCAAFISVPESQSQPLRYLENNVAEFISFLRNLEIVGCERLIFSSSASIYGSARGEVFEDGAIEPRSVYANTKWLCEQISRSVAKRSRLRVINLRYFNPIGTEPEARSGPGNIGDGSLLNELTKAALFETPFRLTGDDWETRDGSGIRDYLDVSDLAEAHILACVRFDSAIASDRGGEGSLSINLGTGTGVTVREMVEAMRVALDTTISVEIMPRRAGDVEGSYANIELAEKLLGWRPRVKLEDSIRSHVAWWRARV